MRRHLLALLFLSVATAAFAQPYSSHHAGDVVQLQDARTQTIVSILPSVGNIAFEMKVKGQNILYWPYGSIEEFKARPGMSGIPFLGPWADRLDEQAFFANGRRFAFDMQLGNVRGDMPIHGFVTTTDRWHVVEAKADTEGAWVTSRLDFYKQPMWMKQWPFAHTIEMTHRLQDGALIFQIDFENPVHSREPGRNATRPGDRSAAQSGACATPYQRYPVLAADIDDGDDVLRRARKYDNIRPRFIHAAVIFVKREVFGPIEVTARAQ